MKPNDLPKSARSNNVSRNRSPDDASGASSSSTGGRGRTEKISKITSDSDSDDKMQDAPSSKSSMLAGFSVSGMISAVTPAVTKRANQRTSDLQLVCRANLDFAQNLQSSGDFELAYALLLQTVQMTNKTDKNLLLKELYASSDKSMINSSLLHGDIKSAKFLLKEFPPPVSDETASLLIHTRDAEIVRPYITGIFALGPILQGINQVTADAIFKVTRSEVINAIIRTNDLKFMTALLNKNALYQVLVVRGEFELAKQLVQGEALGAPISRLEDLPIYEP